MDSGEFMVKISPSLLAADFANLQSEIQKVEEVVDMIHIDVMDGHFVPNITIGIPVVKAIKRITHLPLDVHLMISQPDRYIADFVEAGASILTVHFEACIHLHRTLQQIKSLGQTPWVSINPHTPVSFLEEILPYAKGVLVMGVNPGFTGQSFIPATLRRVEETRQLSKKLQHPIDISVDGGVSMENAQALVASGATVLVAGAAIFHQSDPKTAAISLKKTAQGVES